MSKPVGIIPNPMSGKDIRRLTSHASVFDNIEKINIVRRLLLALDSYNVEEVLIMPDSFGIGKQAIDMLGPLLKNIKVDFLDMRVTDSPQDSTLAAELMNKHRVACIITLGGDGTVRAASKGSHDTPILPLSTGTNNVVPYMIEATIAGLVAAALSQGVISKTDACYRSKLSHVELETGEEDYALVDVALCTDLFVGTRAIWDIDRVEYVITTRGEPHNIGLSSIIGVVNPLTVYDDFGAFVKVSRENFRQLVYAPIAPGKVVEVPLEEFKLLKFNERIDIEKFVGTLAFDGEREIVVYDKDLKLWVNRDGPYIVDIVKSLRLAQKRDFFQVK